MMQEIIRKAREWAISEIRRTNTPILELFELSHKKGIELARAFDAQADIVAIGTLLMDIQLGEAKLQGKLSEHTSMGTQAVKNFLGQFNISSEIKEKIINCVEAHHATLPFTCKEAEICANADCYRFIHPHGVFIYFGNLSAAEKDTVTNLTQLEYKMDEKWGIISLDICRHELEPYYKMFKQLIADSKV